jgi:Flp pilus assembly pilin Flp
MEQNSMSAHLAQFISEEDGSGSTEHGNLYLVVAIALFAIFATFQGGMLSTVSTVASQFDSLKVADSGNSTLW